MTKENLNQVWCDMLIRFSMEEATFENLNQTSIKIFRMTPAEVEDIFFDMA